MFIILAVSTNEIKQDTSYFKHNNLAYFAPDLGSVSTHLTLTERGFGAERVP